MIFGVTGQDGHYLTKLLLDKGYCVIGVKRRSSIDNTERIRDFINPYTFRVIEGDVTDLYSVQDCINQLYKNDASRYEIYNLAAQSHVQTSFTQPEYTFKVNALGPLNIMNSLLPYVKQTDTRFYNAATSELFGDNYDTIKVEDREYHFQDENTRFRPMSPYAVAKLAAHELVNNYRKAYGIHASSNIIFNHESPMRGENFVTRKITKWVGECYRAGKKRQDYPLIRLGNLAAYRDWSFAGDVVESMWMTLQQDKPDDYVIASGDSYSIQYWLENSVRIGGLDFDRAMKAVKIDASCKRPSEVPYLRGNAKKAMEVLGWRPKMNILSLITHMVEADREIR